ncbi:hypothetical protein RCL_jg16378.t1 [Rhizophagus clarus]|uniref:Uncharacterized protein n=1 Tax=Rhizophagus clarus TaxID=94130 RepID=A0A8H3M7X8_9GLOM|nr:hypothetical protein RCL_jg16378.t1 [Rhizophagus clarus]
MRVSVSSHDERFTEKNSHSCATNDHIIIKKDNQQGIDAEDVAYIINIAVEVPISRVISDFFFGCLVPFFLLQVNFEVLFFVSQVV